MAFILCCIKKCAKSILNFGNYLLFSLRSKKQFQKQNVQKILLINLQGVGDIVMTTPLLTALRKEYPLAQINYLCAKENGTILSSDDHINNIVSRKKDDFFSFDFLQTLRQIRFSKYDLVLNLFPAPHSSLLTLLSGAQYIAGPVYSTSSVCNWSSQKKEPTWDVRIQSEQIASLLGIFLENPYTLSLVVKQKQKKDIVKKLNLKRKYIVFNTPSQWKAKQWPVAQWQELVSKILFEKKYFSYQLAFLGTASDDKYVNQIISSFEENKRFENWCGKWTLAELPAILQHASLLITTDSGPMHIASSVQTKTIGLFAVTDPNLLVTRNPFIHAVSSYDTCPEKFQFNHHNEPPDWNQECMKKISVEQVFSKVKQLVRDLR